MIDVSVSSVGVPSEAIATAVTGVLAIGGAIWVGLRQTKILKKQNEILEKQTDLSLLEIKTNQYDKRFQVVGAVNDFILTVANGPNDDGSFQTIYLTFQRGMYQSRYLFDEHVYEKIKSYEDLYYELSEINIRHQSGKADPSDPQRKTEIIENLLKELKLFPDSVKSFMNLTV